MAAPLARAWPRSRDADPGGLPAADPGTAASAAAYRAAADRVVPDAAHRPAAARGPAAMEEVAVHQPGPVGAVCTAAGRLPGPRAVAFPDRPREVLRARQVVEQPGQRLSAPGAARSVALASSAAEASASSAFVPRCEAAASAARRGRRSVLWLAVRRAQPVPRVVRATRPLPRPACRPAVELPRKSPRRQAQPRQPGASELRLREAAFLPVRRLRPGPQRRPRSAARPASPS